MSMDLIFSAEQIKYRGRGLTFDDVLCVPNHSSISSRRHPSLETRLTKNISLSLPIISANMDTITEYQMSIAMAKMGGMGILHRFMSVEDQLHQVGLIQQSFSSQTTITKMVGASIGVKEEAIVRAEALVQAGVQLLTIDIAHGDSIMMLETLKEIKKRFPHVDILAGNVATTDAVKMLIDYGADGIKVGIGPGSMCTTRIITGCGIPQLTAVALCAEEAAKWNIPVVADGGMRNSGDVVKALAAGASSVMLGNMLSGTLETPGEMISGKKRYRGMASKDAQVSWRGELPQGMSPEGVSTTVACKGSVQQLLEEVCGGIRSGMTYINALSIPEIKKKARFMELTSSGHRESVAHGVL
jgi:IMP dehydrogenase